MVKGKKWAKIRKRIYEIIEVGYDLDWPSRIYDFVNVISIIINIGVSILYTYSSIREQYGNLLKAVELSTVIYFGID